MWHLLRRISLTQWILISMAVGALVGWLDPGFGVSLKPLSTVFLRMIKTIVVPIIFGSLVAALLGAPIGALIVLVVLKTAFDLGLHLRERRSADARIPAETTFGRIVHDEPATPDESPPMPPRGEGPA